MSVQSEPFYWLECDGCGVKSTDNHCDGVVAWQEADTALDEADGSGWRIREGAPQQHYCPNCVAPWCYECDRPITDANPRIDDDCWACKGCESS